MDSNFGCNEILKVSIHFLMFFFDLILVESFKHINDLSLKVPLEPLLKHAEGLYILLKQHDEETSDLPPSISAIIFPNKNKNLKKSSNNNGNGNDSDSDATSTISSVKSSRDPSPSIAARPTRTRHLTESHSIDENDSAVVSVIKKE